MILIPDKKMAISTMMAKRSPKGERLSDPAPMKAEVSKDADGEVDGRHAAAQDMLSAMNEKSPQKMMEAMANFHDLHMAHKSKAEAAEEPSED